MESAALTANVAEGFVGAPAATAPPAQVGRFSTGLERLPDSPASGRVGRFCDGIAQAPLDSRELPVGRFSTGREQADTPDSCREGSFAVGNGRRGRR